MIIHFTITCPRCGARFGCRRSFTKASLRGNNIPITIFGYTEVAEIKEQVMQDWLTHVEHVCPDKNK